MRRRKFLSQMFSLAQLNAAIIRAILKDIDSCLGKLRNGNGNGNRNHFEVNRLPKNS